MYAIAGCLWKHYYWPLNCLSYTEVYIYIHIQHSPVIVAVLASCTFLGLIGMFMKLMARLCVAYLYKFDFTDYNCFISDVCSFY